MVEKILKQMPQVKKDIAIIDLLMNFVNEYDLKMKWNYTTLMLKNLDKELEEYLNGNTSQIILNYIDNDNHMLNHMINEFKEDIYPMFDASILQLANKLSFDEMNKMSSEIDNVLRIYSLKEYLKQIYSSDLIKFRLLSNRLIQYIEDAQVVVKLQNITNTYSLNKLTYMQIQQLLLKLINSLEDNSEFKEDIEQFTLHAFVIMAGDKNVQ